MVLLIDYYLIINGVKRKQNSHKRICLEELIKYSKRLSTTQLFNISVLDLLIIKI